MKLYLKYTAVALLMFLSFSGCNTQKTTPETDIDVARAFIEDILHDEFDEAEKLILKDKENMDYFMLFKQKYHAKSKAELEKFKNADIIIHEINNVNDSVTIINYSNSYMKDNNSVIKTVRTDNKWLVDLKYTFSGNL